MPKRKLSRRAVLRGGAGCMVALPLLEVMRAEAQAASLKRFVTYHQPFSQFADSFWPPEPGKPLYDESSGIITFWPRSGNAFLDNPNFEFTRILKPLESIRNEVLVLEGLNNVAGNHDGYCCLLNGYEPIERSFDDQLGGGRSIDHRLAEVISNDTRFPNLQLGVLNHYAGSKGAVSWYAAEQAAPAQDNPRTVFNMLFPGGAATQPMAQNPVTPEMIQAQQKSVLDAAIGQATNLHPKLSVLDRQKLDQYLTAFRSVEQRVAQVRPVSAGCSTPPVPPVFEGEELDHLYADQQPLMTDLQQDMLAMALACDLTRVITFQMCTEGNNLVFTWLGNRARWHDLSHIWLEKGQAPYQVDPADPSSMSWFEDVENFLKMCEWNTQMVFNMQQKLKDHGVWDNTLLFWTTNMSQGNIHHSVNIPLVLLGNVNNYFKTGRHIRLPNGNPEPDDAGNYRDIPDLLVTILQAYGLPDTTWGDPEKFKGPIAEIKA